MKLGPLRLVAGAQSGESKSGSPIVSGLASRYAVGRFPPRLANAADWTPEIVEVFGLPDGVPASAIATLTRRASARGRATGDAVRVSARDLIIKARRGAQARCTVVGPVDAGFSLVGCSHRVRGPSPPSARHLLVGEGVFGAARHSTAAPVSRNAATAGSANGVTSPQCPPRGSGPSRVNGILPPMPLRGGFQACTPRPQAAPCGANCGRAAPRSTEAAAAWPTEVHACRDPMRTAALDRIEVLVAQRIETARPATETARPAYRAQPSQWPRRRSMRRRARAPGVV